jgi:hypothetical protein
MEGVDDLRGRWDITAFAAGLDGASFVLFVNDLEPGPTGFLAAGCMESIGGLAPMSLQAQRNDNGKYVISVRSTVIPAEGDPFGIQFFGPVGTFGQGVADDMAGGEGSVVRTAFSEGTWQGFHHDRERKKCPAVEIPPLNFSVDVWLRKNLRGGVTEEITTALDGTTDIASAGVLVERPDGISVLTPLTSIFSPDVDFVSQFRYSLGIVGDAPVVGQPYIHFYLAGRAR